MLTDVFSYRYLDQPIWQTYGELESRLLVQLIAVVKEALPYYTSGKINETNKPKWKQLHDNLARELGVKELSPLYYSYTQKNGLGQDFPVSGFYEWETVCERFVNGAFVSTADPDRFMKERISFIELALRVRHDEITAINTNLPIWIKEQETRVLPYSAKRVPFSSTAVIASNREMNSRFSDLIVEVNERLRRAKVPISYHTGFFQFAVDQQIERVIAKPFWDLVDGALWKNVDIDMKEALDRRDSNDKDPAIFAAKALESAIMIVSDQKGWTRGTENGAAQYVDNLVSKANGGYIAPWEGEILKDYFRKVRNSLGHGPGSAPMPELTIIQTDWAIETAMSWIRTLVRRM